MIPTTDKAIWVEQQMRHLEKRIYTETGWDITLRLKNSGMFLELLTIEALNHVSETFNIPIEAILSDSHKREFVFAKYVCLELVRKYFGKYDAPILCKLFNRNRTSIIHSYNTINDLKKTKDKLFMSMFEKADSTFKK